jgi:hypothetical protein
VAVARSPNHLSKSGPLYQAVFFLKRAVGYLNGKRHAEVARRSSIGSQACERKKLPKGKVQISGPDFFGYVFASKAKSNWGFGATPRRIDGLENKYLISMLAFG